MVVSKYEKVNFELVSDLSKSERGSGGFRINRNKVKKLIEEFGRQILVPGINEEGQINISKKKICIIGLGALGTVASQYLVRAGIGEIHLIDYDIVEKSNLHRSN